MDLTPIKTTKFGINLADLTENLTPVSSDLQSTPDLSIPRIQRYIARTSLKNWKEKRSRVPAHIAAHFFTFDEVCKMYCSSVIMVEYNDWFNYSLFRNDLECKPQLRVVAKINNSMWRYGMADKNWDAIVKTWNAIRAFDFGVPGFSVTLDFTTGCNEIGYSQYSRTFLDGTMAFLVHYGDKHVMTIGFSVAKGGKILISQVQLKEKKGNRWLFKLPCFYVEHVLNRMMAAFNQQPCYLMNGKDLALRIRKAHGANNDGPSKAEMERIAGLYDMPLQGWVRRGWINISGWRFNYLMPRKVA